MDLKEILANNLKKLMVLNGKSQSDLVEDFGLTQSTVSGWTRGITYPRAEALQMLADYFDITVEELVGSGKGGSVTSSAIKVNVFSKLSGVAPHYNMDDIVSVVEVPNRMGKQGELIALRVKGDTMSPKIDNGDVVIIQVSEVLTGDIVAFTVGNDDAILRKILLNEYGMTFLATNQSYEPMFFSTQDVKAARIKIIGKVIESRRKF